MIHVVGSVICKILEPIIKKNCYTIVDCILCNNIFYGECIPSLPFKPARLKCALFFGIAPTANSIGCAANRSVLSDK